MTDFIPDILKTQLDDLLLKFHNEISEEFQKLKNPISGDMPPPATAQTSQTNLGKQFLCKNWLKQNKLLCEAIFLKQ